MKKHPHLLDKALVAALLLSCMPELLPDLTDQPLPELPAPIALIAPAPDSTQAAPADGL